MEKYAVQNDDLIQGLRNEEHTLMVQVSQHMSAGHTKTAEDESRFQQVQNRLQVVRDQITAIDLRNKNSEF